MKTACLKCKVSGYFPPYIVLSNTILRTVQSYQKESLKRVWGLGRTCEHLRKSVQLATHFFFWIEWQQTRRQWQGKKTAELEDINGTDPDLTVPLSLSSNRWWSYTNLTSEKWRSVCAFEYLLSFISIICQYSPGLVLRVWHWILII